MYHATLNWHPKTRARIDLSTTGYSDIDVWNNTQPQLLYFNEDDHARGRELLSQMGIPKGEPYVCFAVRDPAYLDTVAAPEQQHPPKPDGFWNYQDYRDAPLETFLPMAEWCAAQGYWVLRMGAVVARELPASDPKIIDYSTHHRSDFGDIYLTGTCAFYVGDTAGLVHVPLAFDIPVALANTVPFGNPGRGRIPIYLPKKFRQTGSKELLPYGEVIARGADAFGTTDQYQAAGLELVENSADEISGMVRELAARLDHSWNPEPDDVALHQKYVSLFPEGHLVRRSPAFVAAEFLRRNHDLVN